jgi:hypothetical protein
MLRQHSNEGWIWLGVAGWALVPNPYPWYSLWLIALAPLGASTRVAAVAVTLSFASLLRYVPDAAGAPNGVSGVVLGIVASLPLLALVPFGRRSRYNERLV